MLSALLLPPPKTCRPPLCEVLVSSHSACCPEPFSVAFLCPSSLSGLPQRRLSSVRSLPHPSNPHALYSQSPQPLTLHRRIMKRGPPRPSATASSVLPPGPPGLWDALKAAVTGIPTPVLVAIVAVVLVYAALQVFASPGRERARVEAPPPPPPPAPPIQLGEVTEDELRQYDGSDPDKPLLMAIKGQIYDVSQSRLFYGPGGPYALFAGKDASRALAKMSFEEKDLTGDIAGLGPFELSALQDWEFKFQSKYVKVGTIKKVDVHAVDTAYEATKSGNDSLTLKNGWEANEAVVSAVSQDDVSAERSSPSDDAVQDE